MQESTPSGRVRTTNSSPMLHADHLRLLQQVQSFIEQGLFDSAELLGGLVLCRTRPAAISSKVTQSPSSTSSSSSSSSEQWEVHAHALELYADALVGKKEVRRALYCYQQADAHRKLASSAAATSASTSYSSHSYSTSSSSFLLPTLTTTKVKEARCHLSLNDPSQALRALLSIPPPHRQNSLAVQLTLGKVYVILGLRQDAVIAYKLAISLNPFVLDALVALAGLGVGKQEVWGVMTREGLSTSAAAGGGRTGGGGRPVNSSSSSSSSTARGRNNSSNSSNSHDISHNRNEQEDLQQLRDSSLPWLQLLFSSHLALHTQNYPEAANAFSELETIFFPSSTHCLLQKARVQIEMDLLVDAHTTFGRVVGGGGREGGREEGVMEHMDYYAVLLRQKGAGGTLAGLAHRLMGLDMERPEAWIAASLHSDMKGEKEGSLRLIERAIQVGPRHVLGYHVKGMLLLSLGRAEAAASAFLQAGQLKKDIYASKGLVDAYLSQHRFKEALGAAKEALADMPKNAKAITLVGRVLAHLPEGREKAKRAFQRALAIDPLTVDAVLALADMHIAEGELDSCIELLKRFLQGSGHDFLHTKLGEVYCLNENFSEALACYHTAISMNPGSAAAAAGLERLEKLLRGGGGEGMEGQGEEGEEEGEAGEEEELEDENMSDEVAY